MFKNILVVCTGNICRSPLGEALLRTAVPDRQVSSAGVAAMVGWGTHRDTLSVAQARGLDLSSHHARQITMPILMEADLVLAMDQTHVNWLNSRYPQCRGKVHKWLKWQKNADVPDPYGEELAVFEKCHDLVVEGAANWLKHLK